MRDTNMNRLRLSALMLILATRLHAGDLHGKVACAGTKDSSSAVVYIAAVPGKTFPAPADHVGIDQQNLVFHPHVLPVVVGTTVDFHNLDAVAHNVFSPDACARFNLGTWPKGQSRSYTFSKECVATILCMVHPEMEAFVVALPTPYFGVTGADGSFRIPDIPDGTYVLKVWHPKLKGMQERVDVHGSSEANFSIGP